MRLLCMLHTRRSTVCYGIVWTPDPSDFLTWSRGSEFPLYSPHTYMHKSLSSTHRAMVQYEVALILRAVPRSDLSKVLRGVCTTVLQQGALLRGLDNLGERELPYKMSAHNERFSQGRWETEIDREIHNRSLLRAISKECMRLHPSCNPSRYM